MKEKLLGFAVVLVILGFVVLSTLKKTMREQKWGLTSSPGEIKAVCGKPQADELYKLTYVDGDRRTELKFLSVGQAMFLTDIKWHSNRGSGEIFPVTKDLINQSVAAGYLPSCLNVLAR